MKTFRTLRFALLAFIFFVTFSVSNSKPQDWIPDGSGYFSLDDNQIIKHSLPSNTLSVVVTREMLTPAGEYTPLDPKHYSFSTDQKKVLIFTNTQKVWRINTRGDYWVLDLNNGNLKRIGKSLPESSLMFAKFSPDGQYVAYVCNSNIYVEDLTDGKITPVTTDGTTTLINGTFDWAYEEEFFCRDGFRWSPDSKQIAYWQLDASRVGKFYMINNTDSLRPFLIPVEYPLAGEKPSSCRVGIVDITGGTTTWMKIPGEPDEHYIVRMEFIPWSQQLLIHQLNRKQNQSRLFVANPVSSESRIIYEEVNDSWIDVLDYSGRDIYDPDFTLTFDWLPHRKSLIWISEKDGWRHLYEVSTEGLQEKLITHGDFDVIELKGYDEKSQIVYYMASPGNATQKYLFRCRIDGKGKGELISSPSLKGTHDYSLSPGCRYAFHEFSNARTRKSHELISLKDGKTLDKKKGIIDQVDELKVNTRIEFFQVTTADGITMDGWMVKPVNFDSTKKYPVVLYVYTEPWEALVKDEYGTGYNFLYAGNMAADGYIYLAFDNRGTPVPKGSEWRKSIYRQIGRLNIRDQAMGVTEVLKWPFVDRDRVAVWGWSGGGSATLNLMFQYPDIFKTGISIAAISNQLTYDNIYTERYMGLPQENMEDYMLGSAVTYAKNLKGKLLIIHGTADDNVHYRNAEMLLNELIKHNKKFQFIPYPNRSHSLSEGQGSFMHLRSVYTDFLKANCPPGGR